MGRGDALTGALVSAAVAALSEGWGHPVKVDGVRIDHVERAVFDAIGPGGRPVIVKADTDAERSDREREALLRAASAGVPVPAVVEAHPGSPSILVLSLIVAGELAADSTDAAWSSAGRTLGRLHRSPPPSRPAIGRWLPDWSATLRSILELGLGHGAVHTVTTAADRARLAAEVRSARPAPEAFIHGDPSPQHVLLSAGGATLIDFGDAGCGDPAWDLAVLTLNHPSRLAAVVDGYAPGAALRQHLDAVIGLYRRVRLLGAIAWLADHDLPADVEVAALSREITPPPG